MFTSIFPIESPWARENGKIIRLVAKNSARVFIHPPWFGGYKSPDKDFLTALRHLRIPPLCKVDIDHPPLVVGLPLSPVSYKEQAGRLSDVVFSLLRHAKTPPPFQFGYLYAHVLYSKGVTNREGYPGNVLSRTSCKKLLIILPVAGWHLFASITWTSLL
jgi:hypothetical protein